MAEIESIAPSNLLIDAANPRLREANQGQRNALRAVATDQKRKLLVLAKDIIEHGLNLSDLPIVTPLKNDRTQFIVLEGNRRLCAIKSLENPDMLVGAVDKSIIDQLKKLSKIYLEDPIDSIMCQVVENAEEAHHWIELRHSSGHEGAGIVTWGPEEKARFSARSGKKLPPDSQILGFLEDEGFLTPEERSAVPATSLRRLVNTPEFREKVGIAIENGEVKRRGPKKKVGKALAHVAKELASGDVKTDKIYTADQRIKYANSLPSGIAVSPSSQKPVELSSDVEPSKTVSASANRVSLQPKLRDKLIPRDCVLQITDKRIRAIEQELRKLSIQEFPNALSVLVRVFIELSCDDYIAKMGSRTAVTVDSNLNAKLGAVVQDLETQKKLTKQQANPVKRMSNKDSFLGPSTELMHQYVHNRHVFPATTDLRNHWDSIQPFAVAIWS